MTHRSSQGWVWAVLSAASVSPSCLGRAHRTRVPARSRRSPLGIGISVVIPFTFGFHFTIVTTPPGSLRASQAWSLLMRKMD